MRFQCTIWNIPLTCYPPVLTVEFSHAGRRRWHGLSFDAQNVSEKVFWEKVELTRSQNRSGVISIFRLCFSSGRSWTFFSLLVDSSFICCALFGHEFHHLPEVKHGVWRDVIYYRTAKVKCINSQNNWCNQIDQIRSFIIIHFPNNCAWSFPELKSNHAQLIIAMILLFIN